MADDRRDRAIHPMEEPTFKLTQPWSEHPERSDLYLYSADAVYTALAEMVGHMNDGDPRETDEENRQARRNATFVMTYLIELFKAAGTEMQGLQNPDFDEHRFRMACKTAEGHDYASPATN